MKQKLPINIEENALCNRYQVATAFDTTPNNIGRTYLNPKQNIFKKHQQFKVLDMGSYCILNNITPDMLKLYVEYGIKITNAIVGNTSKSNNRVVIMTPEELSEYEQYKKFKEFNDSKKVK